ncbi:MAG: DNA-binding protein WhiA [Acholeplasmatales bacterium]|nr:DNA-binding protein WhiA [Acholeplasmatales bacterium]
MSFATTVKDDLLKVNPTEKNENLAMLEALLRFGGEVIISRPLRISFTCNNMAVVRHVVKLAKMYYDIDFEIESRIVKRFDNHTVFTCVITKGADQIIKDLSLLTIDSNIKDLCVDNEEIMINYIRGAFLVKGTVNDPMSKDSHLEITSITEGEILFIQRLMNYFELNARITRRKNYLVLYIKAKEAIGDFLYRMGATASMRYYENVIITKDISANTRRTMILDIANQGKTNAAAVEQLKYIQYLEYNYPLEKLDPKILMVMKVRKEHPESSLTEMLDIINDIYDENITKSGLNHRLRKIKEIALDHMEAKDN